MSVYRPAFQSQFGWGTQFDSQNCTMACGAILLDRQTLGKIKTNAPELRKASGVGRTPDGTSMTDVTRAIKERFDISIQNPGPFETFAEFEEKVRKGRGAIIAGDCKYLRGSARCPAGLSRNHAVYVNEVDEDGNFLIYDPAERSERDGIKMLSRKQLRRYAANWTEQAGMVNAAYSRRTPIDGSPDDPPASEDDPIERAKRRTAVLTAGVGGGIIGIGGVVILAGGVLLIWRLGSKRTSVLSEDE